MVLSCQLEVLTRASSRNECHPKFIAMSFILRLKLSILLIHAAIFRNTGSIESESATITRSVRKIVA